MSLKNSYGEANKYTQTGLDVRYVAEQDVDSGYYIYTRYASKTYSYVGQTFESAKVCATNKKAQYLRKHNRATIKAVSSTDESTGETKTTYKVVDSSVYESLCTITMNHADGDAWDVEIQVNEEDVRVATSADVNPETLFATENAWDYDEGEQAASALAITYASGVQGAATVQTTLTALVSDFKPTAASLRVDVGGSSVYFAAQSSSQSGTTWTITWTGSTNLPTDGSTVGVMVNYGAQISNLYTFTPSAS